MSGEAAAERRPKLAPSGEETFPPPPPLFDLLYNGRLTPTSGRKKTDDIPRAEATSYFRPCYSMLATVILSKISSLRSSPHTHSLSLGKKQKPGKLISEQTLVIFISPWNLLF